MVERDVPNHDDGSAASVIFQTLHLRRILLWIRPALPPADSLAGLTTSMVRFGNSMIGSSAT
jgi:hypothetical protein